MTCLGSIPNGFIFYSLVLQVVVLAQVLPWGISLCSQTCGGVLEYHGTTLAAGE